MIELLSSLSGFCTVPVNGRKFSRPGEVVQMAESRLLWIKQEYIHIFFHILYSGLRKQILSIQAYF